LCISPVVINVVIRYGGWKKQIRNIDGWQLLHGGAREREDNVKMDLREVGYGDANWIEVFPVS
jgi:hypothetical protein